MGVLWDVDREQLEKEAFRLGAVWLPESADSYLEKEISKRSGNTMSTEAPECFGVMWDGVGQTVCVKCAVRQECLHKFASEFLPNLGDAKKAKLEALGAELGVSVDALQFALAYEGGGIPPPPVQSKPECPPPPPPMVEDAPEPEAGPVIEEIKEPVLEAPPPAVTASDSVEISSLVEQGPVKKRGRPKKVQEEPEKVEAAKPALTETLRDNIVQLASESHAKKRGRPKKVAQVEPEGGNGAVTGVNREDIGRLRDSAPEVPKRGRGRPKKVVEPIAEVEEPKAEEFLEAEEPIPEKVEPEGKKRKPKKSGGKAKVTIQNPPKTGSAQHASDPVLADYPGNVTAAIAAVQESAARGKWGEHTWVSRWQRERNRCPEIAELTPGTKLLRMWKGKEYKVEVRKGSYVLVGKGDFPTLYEVVTAIVGTYAAPKQKVPGKRTRPEGTRQLCNWSAIRFFNLRSPAVVRRAGS